MEHLDTADARRERELRQRAAVLKQRPPDVRPPPVKFCKVDVNECEELVLTEYCVPLGTTNSLPDAIERAPFFSA
jgi:hypothetical protein